MKTLNTAQVERFLAQNGYTQTGRKVKPTVNLLPQFLTRHGYTGKIRRLSLALIIALTLTATAVLTTPIPTYADDEICGEIVFDYDVEKELAEVKAEKEDKMFNEAYADITRQLEELGIFETEDK